MPGTPPFIFEPKAYHVNRDFATAGVGLRAGTRKGLKGRSAFWFYIVVAGLLLLSEAVAPRVAQMVRTTASDIAAPLLRIANVPIVALQQGLERLVGVSNIYEQNERLRIEVQRLRQYQDTAVQLERENQDLRDMLKVPARESRPAATARIIGIGGGAFERNLIVDAGSGDGVGRDMPVVGKQGLVGRVISVGRLSSRVLLITDLNSRVPVRIERTGLLGMAEGTNNNQMELTFLPEEADVKIGDRLVTSGHGGMFPADIPVAEVLRVENGYVEMRPLSQFDRLDRLRIVAYDAPPPERILSPAGGTP